jgi:hypothetical protein
MTTRLQTTVELPETNCTRENIYELLRTLDFTTGATDGVALQVVAGALARKYALPVWIKYTLTYDQMAPNGFTYSAPLFTLPPKGVIHAVKIKHSAAFTGGLIASYTVSVGISGNLTKYAAASNVFDAPGDTNFDLSSTVGGESHADAGTQIYAAATSTTGWLSDATQGSVDIWVLWSATE